MNWFTNLSLSRKLLVAFGAIIVVGAGVSVGSLNTLRFIQTSNGWTIHTHKVLEDASQLSAAMVDQETGLRGYLLSGDESFLDPYRKGVAAFDRAFAEIKRLTADNPVQQRRLDALNSHAQSWRTSVAEAAITLMRNPATQNDARQREAKGAGKQAMDGIRTLVAEIDAEERTLLAARTQEQASAFSSGFTTIVVGGAVMLAAAALAGLLLSRSVGGAVVALTGCMARLAEGDKTVAVPGVGRLDEVGAMAKAVEVFKENAIEAERLAAAQRAEEEAKARRADRLNQLMQSFEGSITGVVQSLAGSATQMQQAAGTLAQSVDVTNQQSATVASASEQASANVQTVAAAAEELAGSIAEIGRQVAQSSQVAERAVEGAGRANAVVSGLADGAQRIGQVVDLISNIAGQTNLLALNATIEAARAGEAGKGFAVVASEVKSLANQTAKATEDITQQIGSIQGATREAVSAIEEIGRIITEISQISSTIASAVEEQSAATSEISRNVQEAAQGTQNVTNNIAGVTRAAGDTGLAASDVRQVAEHLGQQSNRLRHEVESFLADVKAA